MTIRGFFGGLLIAIGWLVAILAGGCSLIFSFIGGPAALGIVLLFGGIPFLSGLVLIGIGGVIRGKKKRDNYQYKNPYAIPEEMYKTQQERVAQLKEDNDFSDEEKF